MYGVDMTKPGAQQNYDSVFALFASWGLDYVKVDDLSSPQHVLENPERMSRHPVQDLPPVRALEIEEQPVAETATNPTFAGFSVTICEFPVKQMAGTVHSSYRNPYYV